jgi:hypothetical protein
MNKSQQPNNNASATLSLIALCILFAFIVGRGWQGLAAQFGSIVSVMAGLFMAAVAVVLAWAIATDWVSNPNDRATRYAFFFVLLNISALGTVNTMFLTFQASNLFREESQSATQSVTKLNEFGATYLENRPDLRAYDRLDAQVRTLQTKLIDEIRNPQNCGQGPVALGYANELKSLIDFQVNSGIPDCKKSNEVIERYEATIPRLLKNSARYRDAKNDIELRDKLNIFEKESRADLLEINTSAASVAPSILEMKALFFRVAERYSGMRSELGSRKQLSKDVPEKIDTSAISALGDIGQIWPFLLSRLDKPVTYFYLLLAIFLEGTLVLAFKRVIIGSPVRRRVGKISAGPKGL